MDSHQKYLQILCRLSRTCSKINKQRNQMLLSRVHPVGVLEFLPVFDSLQRLVFALGCCYHLCKLVVKDFAHLDWLRLPKTSMDWGSRSNNQEPLAFKPSQSHAHSVVGLRVQRFENGDLDDRNVSLGVHDHHRDEDSMIVTPLCIGL